MVTEGEAGEGGQMHFVVEVVVDAEVAGAGHDACVGEGGAEEVGVEAFDVEGHGGVGLAVNQVDFGVVLQEVEELLAELGEVLLGGSGELV